MSNEHLRETAELDAARLEIEAIATKYNLTGCYTITHKDDLRVTSKWFWDPARLGMRLDATEITEFIKGTAEITQCALKNVVKGIYNIDTIMSIITQSEVDLWTTVEMRALVEENWQNYTKGIKKDLKDILWVSAIMPNKTPEGMAIKDRPWAKMMKPVSVSPWASRKIFEMCQAFWGETIIEEDIPVWSNMEDLMK